MSGAREVRERLRGLARPDAAAFARRFFKTGPGEYGEGDEFLGIRLPQLRAVVREYRSLSLPQVRALLRSPVHEDRLVALLILVEQTRKGDVAKRDDIARLYLANTRRVNNWDLVDASAPAIVGPYAERAGRELLDRLAVSDSLWERRIAMIATLHFIRGGENENALRIARALLGDREDLIHKAVGWMLREVGKRDGAALREFLDEHAATMPRTSLRYAIERFSPAERSRYMAMGGSARRRPTVPANRA